MNRVVVIAVVVLTCSAIGIGAAVLLVGEAGDPIAAPLAPEIESNRSSPDAADDDEPAQVTTITVPSTTTVPTTTPPTTVPTCTDQFNSAYWPATTQGPVVVCPDNPFGMPARALAPIAAGWIAVLESTPIYEVGTVDQRLSQIEAVAGLVSLSDSRNYYGLRDPYWVIHAGPFVSRDEASAYCSVRPALEPCYPRQL